MLKHLGQHRLDFLDQICAFAILPVVITHYNGSSIPGGGMGVGIFFALSGFLIASLLLEEPVLNWTSVRRFYIRRIMRIYPLYALAIGATVLLTHFVMPQRIAAAVGAVPGLLAFTQNSPWVGFSFGVLWTLQVEAWFYLILPLIMWLFGSRRGILLFCAALAMSAPLSFAFPTLPTPLRWGAALATGTLVALAWQQGALARIKINPPTLAIFAIAGIGILLFLGPEPRTRWFVEVMAASLCGSCLIVAFLLRPDLTVFRGLPIVGRISYSMYLLHGLVIDFVKPQMETIVPRFMRPEIYLAIVAAMSYLTYRVVEKPGIRLGRKIIILLEGTRSAHAEIGAGSN